THISDIDAELGSPSVTPLAPFQLEYRGYQTSAYAGAALGEPSVDFTYDHHNYTIWNGSWAAVDGNITRLVTKFHDANGQQPHPETTQHNPWPNSVDEMMTNR